MATHSRFAYVDMVNEDVPTMFNTSRAALITAADNQEDYFMTQRGHYFSVYQECDAIQDVLFKKDATGWGVFDMDTSGDSFQITQGILATTTRMQYTVGTDAFYMKVKLDLPDVSTYLTAGIGFRKIAAYADIADAAAMITAYEDVALISIDAGDIYTHTRLAAGTGTSTDTTDNQADAGQSTLEVYVSAAGVVTFKIDGAAPTVNTNTLTLTDAAQMVPMMVFTAGADTDTVEAQLMTYECGLQ